MIGCSIPDCGKPAGERRGWCTMHYARFLRHGDPMVRLSPSGGDRTQHGGTGSRLHNIWKNMRQRCSNPNSTSYHRYGGRGIKVAPEWDDYAVFRSWSEANGYVDSDVPFRDRLTIDRIDSDGDYEPANCQWLPHWRNAQRQHRGWE